MKTALQVQSADPTRTPKTALGFVHDLRTFATDLVYPVVADRRLTEQILFYRQMATLVKAGIPLAQALRLREEKLTKGWLKTILRETVRRVESGGRMSEAFSQFPESIPPFQPAVLHAGEIGGTLDESLARIADYLEAEQRLRRFVNKHTAYTKILFVIAQFVLPAFLAFVFGGSVLHALTEPLITLACLIAGICLGFAIARAVTRRSQDASLAYERIKWALPAVGRIARDFALCRFGRALGTLYAAGVPLHSALRMSGQASGSWQVIRAAGQMAGYIEHGVSLGDACRGTGFFPIRTCDMLATGAESGSVDVMMLRMADYLESEAETRAHQTGFIASQAFYLLVALYITGVLRMGGGALIGMFVR